MMTKIEWPLRVSRPEFEAFNAARQQAGLSMSAWLRVRALGLAAHLTHAKAELPSGARAALERVRADADPRALSVKIRLPPEHAETIDSGKRWFSHLLGERVLRSEFLRVAARIHLGSTNAIKSD